MKHRKPDPGRHLRLITIDQAIAGASNVLIAIFAARVLGVASFGLFGIVLLVYGIVLGISRALVGDPLLVHTREAEQRPGDAIGSSCLLGTALAIVVLLGGIVSTVWSSELGYGLIALAVCVPLLMLQDLGRYLGFAVQRPSRSVVLDAVWLGLVVIAVAVLLVSGTRSLTWFIVAWAGSGAVTGLLLFRQHPEARVALSLGWIRFTWMFSWRYLISYTSTQGAALVSSSVVGGVAGARSLGAIQGSILLARPFGTFQLAAVAAGVSDISRNLVEPLQVRRRGSRITALVGSVALINGAVMLVLPDKLGELVLGATWQSAKPLLLPTAVQLLFLGCVTGARAGLLGMRTVRKTVVIDVASTVVLLVATVVGVLENGVLGALWAVAVGQAVLAATWWGVFWHHTGLPASRAVGGDVGLEPKPVHGVEPVLVPADLVNPPGSVAPPPVA